MRLPIKPAPEEDDVSQDIETLKARVVDEVEAQRDALVGLSRRIHANPEIGFQEEKAAAWLCEYLESRGFRIERPFCNLATAFRATFGDDRPRIAFLAEYDALARHACGHNLIAAGSVGAAVATSSILSDIEGSVAVIGTPAEEVYGGKVIMAERGAFDGLDVAMLLHPGRATRPHGGPRLRLPDGRVLRQGGPRRQPAGDRRQRPRRARHRLQRHRRPATAHPRQRPHPRHHHRRRPGAERRPGPLAAVFLVRAEDDAYLDEVKRRVIACFEAGATATGARLEYRWDDVQYAPLRANRAMAEAFRRT